MSPNVKMMMMVMAMTMAMMLKMLMMMMMTMMIRWVDLTAAAERRSVFKVERSVERMERIFT